MDDLFVYSRNYRDHLRYLAPVLGTRSSHGLTCSLEKCFFGTTFLECLGFVVTNSRNDAKPEYVTSFQRMPSPTTKKQLQG